MVKAKKKVKKVKEIKVMTVEVEKSQVSDDTTERVSALNSLVASRGWTIIVEVLKTNIAYLEMAILEKKDPVSKIELSDEEVEKLRYKRNLNIELMNTPQNYSKVLVEIEKTPENFDPYWNMDDIRKHEESTLKKE